MESEIGKEFDDGFERSLRGFACDMVKSKHWIAGWEAAHSVRSTKKRRIQTYLNSLTKDQKEDPVTSIECEMEIFSHIGPFDDELILRNHNEALDRIKSLNSVEAVQLILATYCRSDSVVSREELDDLAEFMGVFVDDGDGEDE